MFGIAVFSRAISAPRSQALADSLDKSNATPTRIVRPATGRTCDGHRDTPIRQIAKQAAPQIVAPSKHDRQTLTNLTRFLGQVSTEARRLAIATADDSPATATDAQIGSAQHQANGICSFVTLGPLRHVESLSVLRMVMILHHCVKMPHTASITIASSHPVSTAAHITPAQSPQPIRWYTSPPPATSAVVRV